MTGVMTVAPGVAVAVVLGRAANGRMQGDAFLRAIFTGLLLVGGLLVLQGI